jgi:uncharacterized protein YjbI with pentapeptide repeats
MSSRPLSPPSADGPPQRGLTPDALARHSLFVEGHARARRVGWRRLAPEQLVRRGEDLRGVSAPDGSVLARAMLEGCNLVGARFERCDMRGAVLTGSDLTGASLRDAVLEDADLSQVDLTGADLRGADLTNANLAGAIIERTQLEGAIVKGLDLTGATIIDTDMRSLDMMGSHLSGTFLRQVDLRGASLDQVKLSHATLVACGLKDLVVDVGLRDARRVHMVGRKGAIGPNKGFGALPATLVDDVRGADGAAIDLDPEDADLLQHGYGNAPADALELDDDLVPSQRLVEGAGESRPEQVRREALAMVDAIGDLDKSAMAVLAAYREVLEPKLRGWRTKEDLLAGFDGNTATGIAIERVLGRAPASFWGDHWASISTMGQLTTALRRARGDEVMGAVEELHGAADRFLALFAEVLMPEVEALDSLHRMPGDGATSLEKIRTELEKLQGASRERAALATARVDLAGARRTHAGAVLDIRNDIDAFERDRGGTLHRPVHSDVLGRCLGPVNLSGRKLVDARLSDLTFPASSAFIAASLRGADMRHLEARSGDFTGADLFGASLAGAVVIDGSFRDAVLGAVDATGADLTGSDLRGANLKGARFGGATLTGADLRGADVRGADFRGADLTGVDLDGVDLTGAHIDLQRLDDHQSAAIASVVDRPALPRGGGMGPVRRRRHIALRVEPPADPGAGTPADPTAIRPSSQSLPSPRVADRSRSDGWQL